MNTEKKNRSNLLARECMVSALMQLLESKPLSAISVTEITKKAGVSRMAYYRNYTSKEEIFKTYLDDIFAAYKKDNTFLSKEGFCNDKTHMLHCFRYFYAHRDFIRCLLKSGMGDLLLQALSIYMTETYYTKSDDITLYYTLCAFAGALYNTYIAWIDRDTEETAETMADIMCRIFPAPIQSVRNL